MKPEMCLNISMEAHTQSTQTHSPVPSHRASALSNLLGFRKHSENVHQG